MDTDVPMTDASLDSANEATVDAHEVGDTAPGDCAGSTLETCRCANDAACKRFDDANRCNGHLVCKDEHCVIDPASIVTCDSTGDTTCRKSQCDATTGTCRLVNVADGTACDDGIYCTSGDSCLAGLCTGKPLVCARACERCDEPSKSCVTKSDACVIDGVCRADGEPRPTMPCQVCTPSLSSSAWSMVAATTSCTVTDACTLSAACDGAGTCVGTPRPASVPTPAAPTYAARLLTRKPTLAWNGSGCASSFELQLDDSCATNIDACSFSSPEIDAKGIKGNSFTPSADLPVSTVAPVGARYVWHVRACNGGACSPWSAPQIFDFGRSVKDLDGDGYSDLVVGAPNNVNNRGRVYVFRGSKTGPAATASFTLAGPLGGSHLSNAITLGDVNGDGFTDVVALDQVTSTSKTDFYSSARILVFHGGPSGPATAPSTIVEPPTTQPWVDAPFSTKVYAGSDLDVDGYNDVIIAADQGGTAPPTAYIFRGSKTGLATTSSWTIPNRKPTFDTDFDIVRGLSAEGDFNGDGIPDVLVARTVPASGPHLSLFAGVRGGPPAFVNQSSVSFDMATFYPGQHPLMTAGDFNNDGRADLLFSARADGTGSGEYPIMVYRGASVMAPNPAFELTPTPSSSYGWAMAAGDFDGDGQTDLVVGAPGDSSAASAPNRAYFYRGPLSDTTLPTILKNDSDKSRFGTVIESAGDVNGDGFPDVAMGAPMYTGGQGRAYVFLGSSGGLPVNPSCSVDNPLPDLSNPGLFGDSLGH